MPDNARRPVAYSVGSPNHRGKVKRRTGTWGDFLDLVSRPKRLDLSLSEFLVLPGERQARLKRSPGFISGCTFKGEARRRSELDTMSILALDADHLTPEQFEALSMGLAPICDHELAWHTTAKHRPDAPRVRIFVLLSGPSDPVRATLAARLLCWRAFDSGGSDESISAFDVASWRPAQISYLPVTFTREHEFLFDRNPGRPFDPEAAFIDWPTGDDPAYLPRHPNEIVGARIDAGHQMMEDPRRKPGLVGAFCRTYDIHDVIEQFIPGVYEPGSRDDRYRFIGADSADGVVVFEEGLLVKSYHAHHDPAAVNDRAWNAWDLVRIHKFGHLDKGVPYSPEDPPSVLPSHAAMVEWVQEALPEVVAEAQSEIVSAFDGDDPADFEFDFDFDTPEPPSEPQEAPEPPSEPQEAPEPPEQPEKKQGRLRLLYGAERKSLQTGDYIVKNLIGPGQLGCIFGRPGAGKSVLAPWLGWSVARSEPFFNMKTRGGPVLYVAAEDEVGMARRLDALAVERGEAETLALVTGVRNLLEPSPVEGRPGPELAELFTLVKRVRPRLIFIDTLARSMPGLEENDSAAMTRVVKLGEALAKSGATVIFIHHGTKAEGDTPRGHGSFDGALDFSILVRPPEEGSDIVRTSIRKNRMGPSDFGLAFRIGSRIVGEDVDGDAITAPICEPCDSSEVDGRDKLTETEKAALHMLHRLAGEGATVQREAYLRTAQASMEISHSEKPDNRRRVALKALAGLLRKGEVHESGDLIVFGTPDVEHSFDP